MKLFKYILMLCCLSIAGKASAQYSVTFLPEVQGRTVNGLMMAKIGNHTTERRFVKLVVNVREGKAGKILSMQSAPFELFPGVSSIPQGSIYKGGIQFANNKLAAVIKQSGYFPEGEYEYCFELVEVVKNIPGASLMEQCYDYSLQPFSPLMLTEPYDQERICDKRPTLFWQPILPAIPGTQYRLVLTEVKPGQNKIEALHYNMPIINQQAIPTPLLFYPGIARELEEGKKYAWQVTAYKNDLQLGMSEVWEFGLQCEDSVKEEMADGFRNIEDLAKGNFYIARGKLRFAVVNPYAEMKLKYSIRCLNQPAFTFKRLPTIKLDQRMNQVEIDLSELPNFIDGYYYILDVTLPSGQKKQLRFLYKFDEN